MLPAFPPGLEIKLEDALEGQLAARPRAGDGRMSSSSSAKEFGLVFVKVKVRGPGERWCQVGTANRGAQWGGERTGTRDWEIMVSGARATDCLLVARVLH